MSGRERIKKVLGNSKNMNLKHHTTCNIAGGYRWQLIPHSQYRWYHPWKAAFCRMSLSFNHHLSFVCDRMTQWLNIHYLACPTEALKCIKFLPVISEP